MFIAENAVHRYCAETCRVKAKKARYALRVADLVAAGDTATLARRAEKLARERKKKRVRWATDAAYREHKKARDKRRWARQSGANWETAYGV